MLNFSRITSPSSGLHTLIVICLAIAAGMGLVILPLDFIALVLVLISVVLVTVITPVSAMILLLILSPMRTLITTEAVFQFPFGLDIGQIMVLVLAGSWAVHCIVHKRPLLQFHWSPIFLTLGLFIIVTAFTVFETVAPGAWVREWLKWVFLFAMVVLTMQIGSWRWLVFGLVLAALGNALIGLYIFLGGSGADHLLIQGRFFRAFGTFGQPNPFGAFMGLIAPIAIGMSLGLLARLWNTWFRTRTIHYADMFQFVFYLFASLVLSLGVLISWSRGAWLGFAAALFVALVMLPRRLSYRFAVIAIIAVFAGVLFTFDLVPGAIVDRLSGVTVELFTFNDVRGVEVTTENYALIERLAHWQSALDMGRFDFWLGVGFGAYGEAYEGVRLLPWREPLGHAHNYYLNVFAEAGIIGLVAYLLLLFSIIVLTWLSLRHPDPLARFLVLGLLGSWVYLTIHSLTDNLYVNNLFLHLGVMIGMLTILYRQVHYGVRMRSI